MSPRARVATLATVAVLVTGCGTARSDFGRASFPDVERALERGGLSVCDQDSLSDGLANQALRSRTYEVAVDCSGDDRANIVVDEFDDVEDRDAAVRNFEVAVRPRGSGAAWTFASMSIFVLGTSDGPTFDDVVTALDDLGAQR